MDNGILNQVTTNMSWFADSIIEEEVSTLNTLGSLSWRIYDGKRRPLVGLLGYWVLGVLKGNGEISVEYASF